MSGAALPGMQNRRLCLARRPQGLPVAEDWQLVQEAVEPAGAGGVIVRVLAISIDPAMRGWMNEGRSYVAPVRIGEVMRALGAGVVVASDHPAWPVGMHVSGLLGVQEHASIRAASLPHSALAPIDPGLATLPQWLNVLGMPGMTAYFGLLDVGRPEAGQTVLVSAASGAVGQTVGQLARLHGCRAVGIAGSAAKCAWVVDELGFDACIDYKRERLAEALARHCPQGVDVYFDNVGGPVLDAALANLARGARVVICGAISQYNTTSATQGPKNYLALLVQRARMQGFLVSDYAARYPQAVAELAGHLRAGRIRSREDVVDGSVADFPQVLLRLFDGRNFGKLVLRIASG